MRITNSGAQHADGKVGRRDVGGLGPRGAVEHGRLECAEKAWDAAQLQREVNAQITITSELGKAAAKAIGDYAKDKLQEAVGLRIKAKEATDETESQALVARAETIEFEWGDNGSMRVAAHAATGALSGGLLGAVGAGASAAVMPTLAGLIDKLDLPQPVKQALGVAAAAAVGAVGGASGATAAFNVDLNNRLLHGGERKWIAENAERFVEFFKEQTGRDITVEEAQQILLGNGYRMVDALANKGPGVVGTAEAGVAVAFISTNAFGDLFKATPAEYYTPFFNDGPLAPEQAALPASVADPALGLGLAGVAAGAALGPIVAGTNFGRATISTLLANQTTYGVGAVIGMTANGGVQLLSDGPFDYYSFGMSGVTGALTSTGGLIRAVAVNTTGGFVVAYFNGEDSTEAMLRAAGTTVLVGGPVSYAVKKAVSPLFKKWYDPDFVDVGGGMWAASRSSPVPGWIAGEFSSIMQEIADKVLQND